MTVTDLDSTNGTFVDDREVKALKSAKLKIGSEVVFGCARRPPRQGAAKVPAAPCMRARQAQTAPAGLTPACARAWFFMAVILFAWLQLCRARGSRPVAGRAQPEVPPPLPAEHGGRLTLRPRRRDMFLAKFQLQDRPDGPVSIPVSTSAAKAAEAKIGDEAGVADLE